MKKSYPIKKKKFQIKKIFKNQKNIFWLKKKKKNCIGKK